MARGIDKLEGEVYGLLRQFQNLKELNLSDNHLRKLPHDLSGLGGLANLNLNGNHIEDVSALNHNLW